MAASTFDKTIVLSSEAAERLAVIAENPALPLPVIDGFWEENERNLKEWLSQLKKRKMTEI
jgi:hypothetical protein